MADSSDRRHYTHHMIQTSFRQWRFRARPIPALSCLALLVVLLGMGRWQLNRAETKEELQVRYAEGSRAQPLSVEDAVAKGVEVQGFPVRVMGELYPAYSFLLDNQMQEARPGVGVLTLFRSREGRWILVDRGWMPWGASRQIPEIPMPRESVLILAGRVYYPDSRQIVLKEDDYRQPHWPMLAQKIDLPAMEVALQAGQAGVELAPFVIRLDQQLDVEQGEELLRQWPWMVMSPEKHRAYAFQWFGMALALVILFLVFSTDRRSDE